MRQITIHIRGMSCDSCVGDVMRALRRVPGVRVETVTIGSATVSYEPSITGLDSLFAAIEHVGYEPTLG